MGTFNKDIEYYLNLIEEAIGRLTSTIITTQSDWNEDDNTSPKYIDNKPTIPTAVVPIEVSAWPAASVDTVDELDDLGLTAAEIKAASDGFRTGVLKDGKLCRIDGVNYTSATAYSIFFSNASYALNQSDELVPVAGSVFYSVTRSDDTVTCAAVTIS